MKLYLKLHSSSFPSWIIITFLLIQVYVEVYCHFNNNSNNNKLPTCPINKFLARNYLIGGFSVPKQVPEPYPHSVLLRPGLEHTGPGWLDVNSEAILLKSGSKHEV